MVRNAGEMVVARRSSMRRALVFYLVGGAVLAALILRLQSEVLPDGLAAQLGHNSEAVLFALGLAATIQFGRPWWRSLRLPVLGVLAAAALMAGLAALTFYAVDHTTVKTLNEPLFATAVLTLYVALRRPLRWPWLAPSVVLLVVVLGYGTAFVQQQAESIIAIFVATVGLDWADRSLLEAEEPTSRWLPGWCGFLAAWPVLMLLANRGDVPSLFDQFVDYQARGAEGFWGLLFVHLYFMVLRAPANQGSGR